MWWSELDLVKSRILDLSKDIDLNKSIDILSGNINIDETEGPVIIGKGTKICENAIIKGPVFIGENCLIGNNVFIRGNTYISNNVKLGFSTEIKNSIIQENVTIGPQCFIADSKIEANSYLGAQVRTSNHRLDKKNIRVFIDGHLYDTGKDKLGCLIGKNSALGVQVVILPGRIIAESTIFGPKVLVEKNLPSGKYLLKQQIIKL
jgi:NDP-sugar pyrophosphorylase family protein